MAKNEIIIGRQVDKEGYLINEQYRSVGRVHAKITRTADSILIEDLDSANGTWVDGRRIKSKKINRSNKISLGGADYYVLDLNDVLNRLPLSNEEFSQKILELKNIYDTYNDESSRLQTKMQEEMMTKRMLPTMLLGSLTALAAIFAGNNAMTKIVIGVAGAILSVLVFILATKWATRSSQALKDKLRKLSEQYELDYVCPACGAPFRGKSWEFIRRGGKCPSCKREFQR